MPLFVLGPVRLWKDVTLNLKLKDIDAATEAKHRLEEKQRGEARERKEKEVQWETRVSLLPGSQRIVAFSLHFDQVVCTVGNFPPFKTMFLNSVCVL